jgi:cytochrome c-type biogenesis protein CcmF
VAIRRTVAEDLYLVMATVEASTQTISLQVVVNPLVDWVWLGFGVLAFGTGIALLPERTFAFAVSKLPAEAATTSAAIVLAIVLAGMPRPVYAQQPAAPPQHTDAPPGSVTPPRNELEKQLREEMGCICGTCAHEPLSKCTCSTADQMRTELRAQIDQGKSRDEIFERFASLYGGQHFLSSPIDKGFNRLAWLFPYLLGATGAVVIGFVAARWTRRPEPDGQAPPPSDPVMDERLDDELRNLD